MQSLTLRRLAQCSWRSCVKRACTHTTSSRCHTRVAVESMASASSQTLTEKRCAGMILVCSTYRQLLAEEDTQGHNELDRHLELRLASGAYPVSKTAVAWALWGYVSLSAWMKLKGCCQRQVLCPYLQAREPDLQPIVKELCLATSPLGHQACVTVTLDFNDILQGTRALHTV